MDTKAKNLVRFLSVGFVLLVLIGCPPVMVCVSSLPPPVALTSKLNVRALLLAMPSAWARLRRTIVPATEAPPNSATVSYTSSSARLWMGAAASS